MTEQSERGQGLRVKFAALPEAEQKRVVDALMGMVDEMEHDPGYVKHLERENERLEAELAALRAAVQPADEDWDAVNDEDMSAPDGLAEEPEEFVEECEAECDWVNYGHDLVTNPEHTEWERDRLRRAQAHAQARILAGWQERQELVKLRVDLAALKAHRCQNCARQPACMAQTWDEHDVDCDYVCRDWVEATA